MMPLSRMAIINSEVATGRKMNWREGLMGSAPVLAASVPRPRAAPEDARMVSVEVLTLVAASERCCPSPLARTMQLEKARPHLDPLPQERKPAMAVLGKSLNGEPSPALEN